MKKTIKLIFVLLPVLFFVLWSGTLYYQAGSGKPVVLAVRGYDPRSLLSGRYIDYEIDWDKTRPEQLVRLKKFADISVLQQCYDNYDRKTQTHKKSCHWESWEWRKAMGHRHRFYVPEANASSLDRLFSGRKYDFEVVYACQKGRKPVAVELLIDGTPWRDFLQLMDF